MSPSPSSVAQMFGLEDTIARANKLAQLLDDDAPLGACAGAGRSAGPAHAPGRSDRPGDRTRRCLGPVDRRRRRTGAGAGPPGGLVDQLLDEDGLVERILGEEGLADRLMAEGGLVEKLTARNGPLEQLADVADTLNRLAPGARSPCADDRDPARGGHHPEPRGQPAEQYRRPHPDPGSPTQLHTAAPGRVRTGAQRAVGHRRRRAVTSLLC